MATILADIQSVYLRRSTQLHDWIGPVTTDDQYFDPPYLKGFYAILPDAMPIPDGTTLTFYTEEPEPLLEDVRGVVHPDLPPIPERYSGRNFVSIKVLQVVDDAVNPMEADNSLLMKAFSRICAPQDDFKAISHPTDRFRTVVEMVTFVARPEDLIGKPSKPDPLTRCLDKLFDFHRAYRILAHLPCEELTYKRLFPLVVTTRRRIDELEVMPDGIVMLDMTPNRMGVSISSIGKVNLDDVVSVYSRLSVGDPAVAYMERVTDALFAYRELGKNAEAVVHLATACEVLLDGLLGMLLWEDQNPESDAAIIFSKDITPRVKTEYAPLLGGQWSLSLGAVGNWYEKVGGLRNRVVHAGYQPGDRETEQSFDAVNDLATYVLDRLYDKCAKYPGTAWNFLGKQGFDDRGGVTRRMKEWLDAGEQPAARVKKYVVWRTQVDSLVQRRRKAT